MRAADEVCEQYDLDLEKHCEGSVEMAVLILECVLDFLRWEFRI
jgi:hypothetical protein